MGQSIIDFLEMLAQDHGEHGNRVTDANCHIQGITSSRLSVNGRYVDWHRFAAVSA